MPPPSTGSPPTVRDLPALWRSRAWRDEVEEWLGRQVTVTGPVEEVKARFWSIVLKVPVPGGWAWFKENAPSQAFEAALVATIADLAPGAVPPVLGVDEDRGWLLTADLGAPVGDAPALRDDRRAVAVMADLAGRYGRLQRTLEGHGARMRAARVPAFDDGNAIAYAVALADHLAGLPVGDERRLSADDRRAVDAGLGRIGAAAARLEASGIPDSVDHNDLHLRNALRSAAGDLVVIDLGDSLWSHPFASLRILSWLTLSRVGGGTGGRDHLRVVDAHLEHWTDVASLPELRRMLPAAERLSCLHRAESWRRLMADVPLGVIDAPWRAAPAQWLLAACAPDPFAATRD